MPEPEPTPVEHRPQTFLVLSFLWIFPSLGAVWILIRSASRTVSETAAGEERIQSIPLETWCAVALLALHGLFILLAFLGRKEPGGTDNSSSAP